MLKFLLSWKRQAPICLASLQAWRHVDSSITHVASQCGQMQGSAMALLSVFRSMASKVSCKQYRLGHVPGEGIGTILKQQLCNLECSRCMLAVAGQAGCNVQRRTSFACQVGLGASNKQHVHTLHMPCMHDTQRQRQQICYICRSI